MARPKEFDPADALDDALACFKRHGFAAASMSALVEEMGVGKASIYATYGDKRALYLAALESYAEATVGYVVESMERAERPLAAIRDLLLEVADKAVSPEGQHGCFMVNATAELASNDEEIRAFTARAFERIEDAYCNGLRRAQENGELDRDRDARAIARFLVAQMQSLRILGKARPEAKLLRDVVETALACIE